MPSTPTPTTIRHSACPHDCPSTCALEVERLDDFRIGRLRGAAANAYTAGVICEKVSRYAERVHHPDRLRTPLRRKGAKASGEFEPISWDAALDEVAEAFMRAAQRLGSEAVWPLYYAGTMGLVQRDGIERLRHVLRWSRQHSTICNTLVDAGWRAGPILCGDKRDLGAGPPVTAMLIQNTNPVVVSPEVLKVQRGFRRGDLFVCVHEQFLTDTARLADIVLPATSFVEHDDLYQSGGHSHLQLGPKIIEPYAEARSNHEVICALAQRLGAEHPGFALSAREIIDRTLEASGYPGFDELQQVHWIDLQPDFDAAHFIRGFPQTDGRFHFKPDWSKLGADCAGMPALPDHYAVIEEADAEHPFRMVAAPARSFLNTTFTETPGSRRREQRPSALIHPADCAGLGIAAGERILIGNRRASVRLHAKAFDGLQPGVIVVESIWPNSDFAGGVGINALIGAEAGQPNGGAVFHDTAVWIRKADGPHPPAATDSALA